MQPNASLGHVFGERVFMCVLARAHKHTHTHTYTHRQTLGCSTFFFALSEHKNAIPPFQAGACSSCQVKKGVRKSATGLCWTPPPQSCGHHKVSELLLQGLMSARLVALCFFNSLVIFSSSEFGSSGLLYSSSSSLSELSFIFSVSESCFFLAVAISAACLFRHLVLLFWNQTC